jgi:NAD(P)-dependent dehydrogenase (short-subunit alcohol dehydrogenase family)
MSGRELEGLHSVVVGAYGGIGGACARELASAGSRLTLVGRDPAKLEALADELRRGGTDADWLRADVTDEQQVNQMVEVAQARGPLWACVNAVGSNRVGPTVEVSVEDLDLLLTLNVRAMFLLCQAFGRSLIRQGMGGRIINITSQMGSVGYPGRAVYCTTKHAVNGMTKALGVEWAKHGITVNAVAPTFVDTPMTRPMFADAEFNADVMRRIPRGYLGTLEEVAAAVGFLASPRSSLVNAHILLVDGGWVAW